VRKEVDELSILGVADRDRSRTFLSASRAFLNELSSSFSCSLKSVSFALCTFAFFFLTTVVDAERGRRDPGLREREEVDLEERVLEEEEEVEGFCEVMKHGQ